jgi:putative SOS response-associated peptidase YedK
LDRWLTAAEPPVDLLRPYPAKDMAAYPVSKTVNSLAKGEANLVRSVAA